MADVRSARIVDTALGRCFGRTQYRIEVVLGDGRHELTRRYSEFSQLHDKLLGCGQVLPAMPPRSHIRKRIQKEDFMMKRKSGLELVLHCLVTHARGSPIDRDIDMFLDLPARSPEVASVSAQSATDSNRVASDVEISSIARVPDSRPLGQLLFYQVASSDVSRMEELHRCVTGSCAHPMLDEVHPRRRPVRMVPWAPSTDSAHALVPDDHSKRHSYAIGLIHDKWYYLKDINATPPTDESQWEEFDETEEKAFSRAFWAKRATRSGFLAEYGPEGRYNLFVASESSALQNELAIKTGLAKGSLGAQSVVGFSTEFWHL